MSPPPTSPPPPHLLSLLALMKVLKSEMVAKRRRHAREMIASVFMKEHLITLGLKVCSYRTGDKRGVLPRVCGQVVNFVFMDSDEELSAIGWSLSSTDSGSKLLEIAL